jgi:YHS domain-containing protein
MLMTRRIFIAASFAAISVSAVSPAVARDVSIYTGLIKGVAVGGYDPVAYFTASQAVKGNPAFSYTYKDSEWRFASEANRALFIANPQKYEPQYGGHCSYAAARNYKASGDPQAWRIVEGKLYLNYDPSIKKIWEKNIPGEVSNADRNWRSLASKPQ